MLELTIVVPAFNEAHRLEAGMLRFEAAVSAGAIDLEQTELVVIDDGSTVHPLHDSVTMLRDVYRSRRGMLTGPPVPTITVRPAEGGASVAVLAGQVSAILAEVLDGAPVPVIADGTGVTALLAMVDPADASLAHEALRLQMAPAEISRRALTLDGLARFGPLTGLLDASGTKPAGR